MVRTGRGSTVKERGGATHYSYGEGSLTIHMVRDISPSRGIFPSFELYPRGSHVTFYIFSINEHSAQVS